MKIQEFLDSVQVLDTVNGIELTPIAMEDKEGVMAMYLLAFSKEDGDIIICDIDNKGLEFKIIT